MTVDSQSHCLPHRAIDLTCSSKSALSNTYYRVFSLSTQQLSKITSAEILHAHQRDPCIGEMWSAVIKDKGNAADKEEHPDVCLLLKEWEKLKLID